MKRFFFLVIIVFGLIGASVVFKNGSKNILPGRTLKGVSLSPLSFKQSDFLNFLEKTKEAGTLVSWAGDWQDLKKPESAPFVLVGLSKKYGYTPVIIVSAETANKEGYIAAVTDFIKTNKLKYIGLGNELNYTFRNNPSQINTFADIFSESYDAVKEISPNTKVFTIFQYETPQNALTTAQKFPKADLIAFTTYPEIISITSPSNIPSDYYFKIKNKINRPVAFTEIGWRGINQADQASFILKFFDLTKKLNPEFVIWPFLYDQKETKPFQDIGLFDSKGVPRKAWEVWKSQ